jgi:hypothetical protein
LNHSFYGAVKGASGDERNQSRDAKNRSRSFDDSGEDPGIELCRAAAENGGDQIV